MIPVLFARSPYRSLFLLVIGNSSELSSVQNSQCEVYVENTQNDINSVFNNLGMMYEKGELPYSLDDDTESNFNDSIMDSEGVVAISKPADLEKFYSEGNPPVDKVPIKRKHKHSPATRPLIVQGLL
ncbi:hypothetical protein AVEN_266957-1 [Araneus ventricosus]|uniref:Uncharacterized protein n=1 Tax=Araneus ventricosus TaxID=182803 RepID=A0A4Y2KXG1_ARAVE|nr:hypothetical protein AVEN_266957-1 [Araneus ventricosus]